MNTLLDPCNTHLLLKDSSRLLTNLKAFPKRCDQDLIRPNWYRLSSDEQIDTVIPTTCTAPNKCQSLSTAWVNGSYPKGKLMMVVIKPKIIDTRIFLRKCCR